jgi:hypothetical protein
VLKPGDVTIETNDVAEYRALELKTRDSRRQQKRMFSFFYVE